MKNLKINSMITLKPMQPMKVLNISIGKQMIHVEFNSKKRAWIPIDSIDKVESPKIDWDEIKPWEPLKFEGKTVYLIAKNNYAPIGLKDEGFAIVTSTFHAVIASEIFVVLRDELSCA